MRAVAHSAKAAVSKNGDTTEQIREHGENSANEALENVIVRGVKGTVVWFSLFDHYGFITREDNGEDVYCHISSVVQRGRSRFGLDPELQVEFDVVSGFKGSKAIAITLPGGKPVENTRIIHIRRKFDRRNNRHHIKSEGHKATLITANEVDDGKLKKDDKN